MDDGRTVSSESGRASRRLVLLAAGSLCATAAFPQARPSSSPSGLPLRNLLVELRQGEASSMEAGTAGVDSGAVVVGSDGRVRGRATVGIEARGRSGSGQTSQQLTVLNGGRASLRMGTSEPVHWLQIGWTPQGPTVLGLGSSLLDTGRGVVVQPRWAGGDAPVTVEVEVESSSMSPATTGGTASRQVLTTLALPLGQWVTVAETGEAGTRSERGTLSTREIAGDRRLVVQMRVSVP